MNKAELAEAVAADLDISRKQALEAIDSVLDNIVHSVVKDDKVSLVGFGTFARAKRAARTGVNPATGEKIKIPAKKVPKFRPGKAWKDML